MPGMDDFYAFKSTSSSGGETGSSGCLGPGATCILVILGILWLIGKLSG